MTSTPVAPHEPLPLARFKRLASMVESYDERGLSLALKKGVCVNSSPKGERSLLSRACDMPNNHAIILALLHAGAHPQGAPRDAELRQEPLRVSLDNNDEQMARALIIAGAPLNLGRENDNELWEACLGPPEAAQILIRAGVDINALDHREETPLMRACAHALPQSPSRWLESARLLINAGADLCLANVSGHTALDLARFFKAQPAIDLLCVALERSAISSAALAPAIAPPSIKPRL